MDPSAATNPQGAIIQGIVLIILLLLSAFFSSAETSLTTVNKIKRLNGMKSNVIRVGQKLRVR